MTDEVTPGSTPAPPAPDAGPQPVARRRVVLRWTRRVFLAAVAILAAVAVSFFSIDLGRFDWIRKQAEAQATRYLERPMHIGRIRALMTPGAFAVEDVVIEGRTPQDRPFLTARRITVSFPWWAMFRREVVVEVRMTDWTMVIERSPDGSHNMPRLRPRTPRERPSRFKITVPFVYADRGTFTYDDRRSSWSIVAPRLDVDVVRAETLKQYVGTAHFAGGSLRIQRFKPMRTDFATRFVVDGSKVRLRHIDLETDGSSSHIAGELDFSNWPEQQYDVDSTVDLARMREIFFADQSWRVAGEGRFRGIYRVYRDGQDLKGTFSSDQARVNDLEFPNLRGALEWLPRRFAVTEAVTDFAGGGAAFSYVLEPLGTRHGATATFGADYTGVDLQALGRMVDFRGLDLRGRADGRIGMEWPNGRFREGVHGGGATRVTPPDGVTLAEARLPGQHDAPADPPRQGVDFDPMQPVGPIAVGGEVSYGFDRSGVMFGESAIATPSTYVSFRGRTDGEASDIPFHVTSVGWQDSARLFAAVMTAVATPSGAIEVDGRGTFDGTMTGALGAPRIVGTFAGESMRAWDVTWGSARGDVVIENRYLDLTNGLMGDPAGASIRADGRFSLGYPPKDGGKEIDARLRIAEWPLADLRHAFRQDDWPVDGTLTMPALELTGAYRTPSGKGQLRLDRALAWREPFETATAALTFDGKGGLDLDRIEMTKTPGIITGAAHVDWLKGEYSFVADTREASRLSVESLTFLAVPRAPLTGLLELHASGRGSFDAPAYEFEIRVADLYAGDEEIGRVYGKFGVKNDELRIEQLNAVSTRISAGGSGSISLEDPYDAELSFAFNESSIDPYVRKFVTRLPDYTRAVVSGGCRIAGPLADTAHLLIDTKISAATLTLFDYELTLQPDRPALMTYEDGTVKIGSLGLAGEDTKLDLTGEINVTESRLRVNATGEANLAILQGFFPTLTSRGSTILRASLTGDLTNPTFSGEATIKDGRLRPQALPQGLDRINGLVRFDAAGINIDGVSAQMGGGKIAFGGIISRAGYRLDEFDLTATGRDLRLRYPRGFTSTVDLDLMLTGSVARPVLQGTVQVTESLFTGRLQTDIGVLGFAAGGPGPGRIGVPEPTAAFPMDLDIDIRAVRALRVNENDAQIVGSAEMRVFGTLDHPLMAGWVDIDSGEVLLYGNRYTVRHGQIELTNPATFEPYFDIEAVTRAHAGGQTYNVDLRFRGTFDKLDFTASSDPGLPEIEIVALLLGQAVDIRAAELNTRLSQERQAAVMQQAAALLLTSAISSRVGQVVEKTTLVDTLSLTPVLGGYAARQLNPTARVTLGTRLGPQLFLTYSRAVSGVPDEIILLEYEQSDRVSWILSRNEDRTFAIDFRIRHVY